ncbi:hypothetical protein APS67_001327 [Streptomyces sp. AVP053U2]|nr:hypothetical protein APS67_001327 [Streptomyces sp. AVP053U2]
MSGLGLLARKPPQEQIRKALARLVDAGTLPVTALAQRVWLPPTRGGGSAVVLRHLLNHDGVHVLETLPGGPTLRLHTALLRDRFDLRQSPPDGQLADVGGGASVRRYGPRSRAGDDPYDSGESAQFTSASGDSCWCPGLDRQPLTSPYVGNCRAAPPAWRPAARDVSL